MCGVLGGLLLGGLIGCGACGGCDRRCDRRRGCCC